MTVEAFVFRVSITKDIILNLELYQLPIDEVDRDFFNSAGYNVKRNEDKVKRRLLKMLGTVPLVLEMVPPVTITSFSNPNTPIFNELANEMIARYNLVLMSYKHLQYDLEQTIEDIKRNGIVSYIRHDIPQDLKRRLFEYRLAY